MGARALGLVLCLSVFADAATASEDSKWRTSATLELGSNLYSSGSSDYSASSSLVLIPTWRWTPDWTVAMSLSAAKDLTGFRDLVLYDPSLRISRSAVSLNPFFSVSPAVGMILPATSRSREREGLITAVRPALRLSADLSRLKKPVLRDVSLMYEVAVSRAFHQYTTSTTGSVNTAWKLSNLVSLGYAPGERWSFSADFMRNTGWSYQGGARHSFSLGESVNYQFSRAISLAVGLTNDGDVLRANGLNSNIAIFDSTSSRVFTSFTVIF